METPLSLRGSTLLDEQDEDVRIAVGVLGSMRASTNTSAGTSAITSGQQASTSSGGLLHSAINIYESSKACSPSLVRYGAEMLESGLSTGVSRLGLDRYRYKRTPSPAVEEKRTDMERWLEDTRSRTPIQTTTEGSPAIKKRRTASPSIVTEKKQSQHTRHRSNGSSSGRHSRHNSASRSVKSSKDAIPPPPVPHLPRMIVPGEDPIPNPTSETSRWLAIRGTATSLGTSLGGLGAALTMSEDAMRRLKFCLSWLMYATSHIDKQILLLRDFTEGLQRSIDDYARRRTGQERVEDDNEEATITITPAQQATLHALRSEIVNTVRQVVDVVSKYAGGSSTPSPSSETSSSPTSPALSSTSPASSSATASSPDSPVNNEGLDESARLKVKAFILGLPVRWKDAVVRMGVGPGLGALQQSSSLLDSDSNKTTKQSPPSSGRNHHPPGPGPGPPTMVHAVQTAQRVLALATESLDMMRGVTGVVRESLERADGWVETFRLPRSNAAGDIANNDDWEDRSTFTSPPFSRRSSMPSLSRTESASSLNRPESPLDDQIGTPGSASSPRSLAGLGRMSIDEVVGYREEGK